MEFAPQCAGGNAQGELSAGLIGPFGCLHSYGTDAAIRAVRPGPNREGRIAPSAVAIAMASPPGRQAYRGRGSRQRRIGARGPFCQARAEVRFLTPLRPACVVSAALGEGHRLCDVRGLSPFPIRHLRRAVSAGSLGGVLPAGLGVDVAECAAGELRE